MEKGLEKLARREKKATHNKRYMTITYIQIGLVVFAILAAGYIGIHLLEYQKTKGEYDRIRQGYVLAESVEPTFSVQMIEDLAVSSIDAAGLQDSEQEIPENEPISYFFKEDIYYEKAS